MPSITPCPPYTFDAVQVDERHPGRVQLDRIVGTLTSEIIVLNLAANTTIAWALLPQDADASHATPLPIAELPCRVGRGNQCPLRMPHATVSTIHAEFDVLGDQLHLRDLGSRNGTFINGQRVGTTYFPLNADVLLQFGELLFRLTPLSTPRNMATAAADEVADLALALAQFEKLIDERAVMPHFQWIVRADNHGVFAAEALGRSRLFGLSHPEMMFKAASYLHKEVDLSRMLRVESLAIMPAQIATTHLFLNTHVAELRDLAGLIISMREVRKLYPQRPITLEIHEAAAVDMTAMKMLRLALSDLQMGLAYDDFGAGQARLAELVEARPNYLKFDMKLVRNIHEAHEGRRRLVGTLVRMARELGIVTLAEGVETLAEVQACTDLGFELLQGYYFGRPATGEKLAQVPPRTSPITAAEAGH